MKILATVCLLLLLTCGGASAQDDPKKELADAYAKLDALKTYRERITFKMQGMSEAGGMGGEVGERIAGMMAPFSRGILRENVGKSISRMYWSFPNPSLIGGEITIELVEQGNRFATRYDDPKMLANAEAIDAAAKAKMAAQNAIATAKAIAGASMNPLGAIADLAGTGMQAAGAARAATRQRDDDWGKWVCSTDEPIPDKTAAAPVKREKPGTVGGRPVSRYRVFPPPGEEEFAPHIVSVDTALGLPVQVEVLSDEDDQVFTVIEFFDFDAPIKLAFPKCDKHR